MTDQLVRPRVAVVDIDRRSFLNRALLAALSVFGVAFGGASIAYLWPDDRARDSKKINVGRPEWIKRDLRELEGRPIYNAEGQFYLVAVTEPHEFYVDAGVVANKIMAIWQQCPHDRCRVPYCPTSGWFECPCGGDKFNRIGERMPGGPSPTGMLRFPIENRGGYLFVDTLTPTAAPPFGFDSIRQEPAGPNCAAYQLEY